MSNCPTNLVCIAATATILAGAGASDAALNIDIRAVVEIGPGTLYNTKFVDQVVPGSVIVFDIFAVVRGTNTITSDDKFIAVDGSIVSSNTQAVRGDLLGDYVRSYVDDLGNFRPGFDGVGASTGFQQDLDGDGDLDVGSNIDSDPNHFWSARYLSAPDAIGAGSLSPTTGGRRIGFGTFLVTSGASKGITRLNFDGRNAAIAARYIQDGVMIEQASVDGVAPVTIRFASIPEPASLGMATFATFAMMHRRHRTRGFGL